MLGVEAANPGLMKLGRFHQEPLRRERLAIDRVHVFPTKDTPVLAESPAMSGTHIPACSEPRRELTSPHAVSLVGSSHPRMQCASSGAHIPECTEPQERMWNLTKFVC